MVLVLAGMALAVFWPVGNHAFVGFDDDRYITENSVVRGGLSKDGVAWAFATGHAANWHPLTWLSHMLDVELFGLDAGWHHRMSVLLHLLNTGLLFLTLRRMTGAFWRSGFAAALFALHPLHVESVAWAAERKDVLSTLFWILAVRAYVEYAARGGTGRYLLVAVFFALGLLSKPMLVTLPFTLLLLDYWPLGRARVPLEDDEGDSGRGASWLRLVGEKVPLFAMTLASCVVTYLVQADTSAVVSASFAPLADRAANAAVSYATYIGKMVWPAGLSVFYPHPGSIHESPPTWKVAGSVAFLGAVSVLAYLGGKRRRYLPVGWLWYLGTLVPVIGLVQVGSQAMADRYTYVPLIGVLVMAVWGLSDAIGERPSRRMALAAAGGVALLALGAAARVQVGYWRDSITLLEHALDVTSNNWLIHANLGVDYADRGRLDEAILHYRESIRIKPDYPEAHNNLGYALLQKGETDGAILHFLNALRYKPGFPIAIQNLRAARYLKSAGR